MKELSELNLPDDVRYSDDHEWVRVEAEIVKIGISVCGDAQDRRFLRTG